MVSTKPQEAPEMLTPVVLLPIPAALFLLALAAYTAAQIAGRLTYPDWTAIQAAQPRHRLTPAIAADPNRRDWAAIYAERINPSFPPVPVIPGPTAAIEYDPLDHRVPLSEVERISGQACSAELADLIEQTRQVDGNGMWSWQETPFPISAPPAPPPLADDVAESERSYQQAGAPWSAEEYGAPDDTRELAEAH